VPVAGWAAGLLLGQGKAGGWATTGGQPRFAPRRPPPPQSTAPHSCGSGAAPGPGPIRVRRSRGAPAQLAGLDGVTWNANAARLPEPGPHRPRPGYPDPTDPNGELLQPAGPAAAAAAAAGAGERDAKAHLRRDAGGPGADQAAARKAGPAAHPHGRAVNGAPTQAAWAAPRAVGPEPARRAPADRASPAAAAPGLAPAAWADDPQSPIMGGAGPGGPYEGRGPVGPGWRPGDAGGADLDGRGWYSPGRSLVAGYGEAAPSLLRREAPADDAREELVLPPIPSARRADELRRASAPVSGLGSAAAPGGAEAGAAAPSRPPREVRAPPAGKAAGRGRAGNRAPSEEPAAEVAGPVRKAGKRA
jgi:hypothetical protein